MTVNFAPVKKGTIMILTGAKDTYFLSVAILYFIPR